MTKSNEIKFEKVYRCGKSVGVVYTVNGHRCSTLVGNWDELRASTWENRAVKKYRRRIKSLVREQVQRAQTVTVLAQPSQTKTSTWHDDAVTDAQISYILSLTAGLSMPWFATEASNIFSNQPTQATLAGLKKGEASRIISLLKMDAA